MTMCAYIQYYTTSRYYTTTVYTTVCGATRARCRARARHGWCYSSRLPSSASFLSPRPAPTPGPSRPQRVPLTACPAHWLDMDPATEQGTARLLRGGRGDGARKGLFLPDILVHIYEDHPPEYRKLNLGSLTNAAKIAEFK